MRTGPRRINSWSRESPAASEAVTALSKKSARLLSKASFRETKRGVVLESEEEEAEEEEEEDVSGGGEDEEASGS